MRTPKQRRPANTNTRSVIEIATLSIGVSLGATLVATCLALPGALWIVHGRSHWRMLLLGIFNVGLGLPPVAVGLAVAMMFWRSGPLGRLDLIYTPLAMLAFDAWIKAMGAASAQRTAESADYNALR